MNIEILEIPNSAATSAIFIDHKDSGLRVRQTREKTLLYRGEISPLQAASLGCEPVTYEEITLPSARYSLLHDKPASGNPGRTQFLEDLRGIL